MNGNKTVYHIDKVIRETGRVVDDGLHEIFVNTVVDDGSDTADLMSCFVRSRVQNVKFPVLSRAVTKLKDTEEGVTSMCRIMQHYEDIARKEGRAEGRAEGRTEGRVSILKKLIESGTTFDEAMRLAEIDKEEWPMYRQLLGL